MFALSEKPAASAARPVRYLGAPAPGGLALPAANPTPSQLYAPRGVWVDDQYVVAVDSGNHRVLIWHGWPASDHAPADVVLGQKDAYTEGPNAAGLGPEQGFFLPTAAAIHEGHLIVADSWNHRLVVYHGVPQSPSARPILTLGGPAGAAGPSASTLYWPYGFTIDRGRLIVTDTGNRRVLFWDRFPWNNEPADAVLGQPDFSSNLENRGGPASAQSFRWPHAAAAVGKQLWIADAGNHRILAWPRGIAEDREATHVLGQPNFTANTEFVMAPQSQRTLRFPYAIAGNGLALAAADTANNRVLLWSNPALDPGAQLVLGQRDFTGNGENRWKSVEPDSFCWPYGIAWHGRHLAIADSGNNRVMIWETTLEETTSCA